MEGDQVTADFESAVWGAFRKVLPEVQLLGCAFHWNQALWRKVKELGLQTAYMRDWATNGYIRRLMALPFLPHETIAPTFDSLKPEATTEPLQQFVSYIEENWIRSTVCSLRAGSLVGTENENRREEWDEEK